MSSERLNKQQNLKFPTSGINRQAALTHLGNSLWVSFWGCGFVFMNPVTNVNHRRFQEPDQTDRWEVFVSAM